MAWPGLGPVLRTACGNFLGFLGNFGIREKVPCETRWNLYSFPNTLFRDRPRIGPPQESEREDVIDRFIIDQPAIEDESAHFSSEARRPSPDPDLDPPTDRNHNQHPTPPSKMVPGVKSALLAGMLAAAAVAGPVAAQTAFFSDMARECDGVYREGLNFPMKTDMLNEASGIAVSRKHPNVLWSHNDGSPQKLVAMTTNPGQEGLVVSTLSLPDYIKPASGDGDWEDISSAECPDGSGRLCLWIADIGDNSASRDSVYVYAVVEPPVNPIVVFNDPLEDVDDFTGRKLLQWTQRNRSPARGGYLNWLVGQARNNGGIGNDAHERFNKAVHDPQHYNYNGDLREEYRPPTPELTQEQVEELKRCEADHKFLIENYVAPNDAWVYEFKYPTGAMDSEAFAVAPDGSKFWVIEKTTGASAKVFESAPLFQQDATEFYREVDVEQVAALSPPCFASNLGCPGDKLRWSVTGMDVHPQGNKAIVQTYAGPFEYNLASPFDLSSMSSVTPQGGFSSKGAESVGYGLDGMSVWQVPEARDEVGCQYVQPLMCTFSSTSLP